MDAAWLFQVGSPMLDELYQSEIRGGDRGRGVLTADGGFPQNSKTRRAAQRQVRTIASAARWFYPYG
jgi:hypothetical protein